jgi:hypothetical protein
LADGSWSQKIGYGENGPEIFGRESEMKISGFKP